MQIAVQTPGFCKKPGVFLDYLAFLRVMHDTLDKKLTHILSFCLMSNHWHPLLWPARDGDLGALMQPIMTMKAVCPTEVPLTTSIAKAGRATTVHAIKKWFDR